MACSIGPLWDSVLGPLLGKYFSGVLVGHVLGLLLGVSFNQLWGRVLGPVLGSAFGSLLGPVPERLLGETLGPKPNLTKRHIDMDRAPSIPELAWIRACRAKRKQIDRTLPSSNVT